MTDGERNGHGRMRKHGEGTARTPSPRGGGQPFRSLHALGFFFHVFFHGNMGKGAAIITAMAANTPLFNPAFLNKRLIALGTDKDPFDVMDLSLIFHAFPPSEKRRMQQAIKPATGDFSFATGCWPTHPCPLPISRLMQEMGEGVDKISSPLMGED